MRAALALVAIGGLFTSGAALEFFEEDGDVTVLADKKAVVSEVFESFQPAMIGVFSENSEECPNCAGLAKEFQKAAENLAGFGVESFAVDCTNALPKCHGLTSQLQVRSLPAVAVLTADPTLNPYTRKMTREIVGFEGNGRATSISKFALSKVPVSPALMPRIANGDTWPPIDSLPTPGTSLVLLFTDRDSPSPLYKALAHHFRGRLSFAEAGAENSSELQERFAVEVFPTLLVALIDKEKKDPETAAVYKGDLKDWGDITSFLENYALSEDAPSAPKSVAAAAADAKKKGGKGGGGAGASKGGNSGLVASSAAAVRLFTSSSDVNSLIKLAQDTWMVLYHSFPGSSSSDDDSDSNKKYESAVQAWSEAAGKCGKGELLRAGEVNCTATPDLCGKDVTSFLAKKSAKGLAPAAVKVFPYGVSEKADMDDVMGGGSTFSQLEHADDSLEAYATAADSFPDLTYKVNGYTMEGLMVEAAKSSGMVLALFSNKAEPPAMLKQLAIVLKGAVSVAFFPEPDSQALGQFQVKKVPAFVTIFAQPDDANNGGSKDQVDVRGKQKRPEEVPFAIRPYEPHMYGKPTFEAILGFSLALVQQINPASHDEVVAREQPRLDALYGRDSASGANGGNGGGGPYSGGSGGAGGVQATHPGELKPIMEVSKNNWESLCPSSSAQLCAMAFLSARPGTTAFDDELAIVGAAAAKHVKDPYTFVWVDGNCYTDFADEFNVQPSKLPTLVAYSPKKNRYAGFIGVFGVDTVSDLLTGVLSGRVKTQALFQPVAAPSDTLNCAELHESGAFGGQQAIGDADAAAEPEEDMGDMMAEILAEEARAKEELEKEVAAEAAAKEEAEEEAKKAEAAAAAAKAKKKKKKKAAAKKKGKKDDEL